LPVEAVGVEFDNEDGRPEELEREGMYSERKPEPEATTAAGTD
jgi:hypothetical protein